MVFEIYNADGYVRSAEINSLEDIQNLPERFKQTNECYCRLRRKGNSNL